MANMCYSWLMLQNVGVSLLNSCRPLILLISTWGGFIKVLSLCQSHRWNQWRLHCLLDWVLWLVDSLHCHAPMLFCSPSAGTHKSFTDRKTHKFTGLVGSLYRGQKDVSGERREKREPQLRISEFLSEEIPCKHKSPPLCASWKTVHGHHPAITASKQTKPGDKFKEERENYRQPAFIRAVMFVNCWLWGGLRSPLQPRGSFAISPKLLQ